MEHLTFPAADKPVSDRDCIIAMFSELAAEATRLSGFDRDIYVSINCRGIHVDFWSSDFNGPVRRLNCSVFDHGVDRTSDRAGPICLASYKSPTPTYVSHSYFISYDVDLATVQKVVDEIHALFRLIESGVRVAA
ncbi:hypothetical protein KQ940_13245 [Marinobacterium sp. D7]|uniref:hypothetical protein n=1 Tax=Marinobacterium ramblicola TaxID=2849041 RepID=UPI001C2DE10E|nr:hypothetical protein [Marinobacterium ramblicola]MBV1789017.1 hypothetical protein [Marinobacterium ramblicola]